MKRVLFISLIFSLLGQYVFLQETAAQQPEQQEGVSVDTSQLEKRPFQFTFLFPPLSTNGPNNGEIVNDVSLNLFLGVSGGVEKFEAGMFLNIDKYYVKGFQIAGFGNTNGGYLAGGAQLAGFYNVTGLHAEGAQLAGFVNVSGTDLKGAQIGGFVNVAGSSVKGFQGAGFINVAGNHMKGAQAAGFINITGKRFDGFQGAGFLNIADETKNGAQLAGLGNISGGGVTEFQGAGFFNIAGDVKGGQVAGFMNVGETVRGVQLSAFLNICDSIQGVPIGLINIVRQNGYRKFEFSISEVQYANFSYKMGVKKLYNIYSFGKPFGPGSRWMFGGGLGTQFDLSERMMFNIEATIHQELWISDPSTKYFLYIDRLNLYNTAKFLFGWNLDNAIDLYIGPTINVSVTNSNPEFGVLSWHEIPPYSFFNRTKNNFNQTNVQMWIGIQGGVRF